MQKTCLLCIQYVGWIGHELKHVFLQHRFSKIFSISRNTLFLNYSHQSFCRKHCKQSDAVWGLDDLSIMLILGNILQAASPDINSPDINSPDINSLDIIILRVSLPDNVKEKFVRWHKMKAFGFIPVAQELCKSESVVTVTLSLQWLWYEAKCFESLPLTISMNSHVANCLCKICSATS